MHRAFYGANTTSGADFQQLHNPRRKGLPTRHLNLDIIIAIATYTVKTGLSF